MPVEYRGKAPINAGGVNNAMTKKEQVREYFTKHPDANYGIVTGSVSGLTVIDVDGPEGKASLRSLDQQNSPLPQTTTVRTASGYHFYFANDGAAIKSSVGTLGPGLDVRGEGGMVVGVGSIHKSGKKYLYVRGRRFMDVGVAPLPGWLASLLTAPISPVAAAAIVLAEDNSAAYFEAAVRDELQHLAQAREGNRNDTLNKCAFRLGQLLHLAPHRKSELIARLTQVARQIGLKETEIGATITSGVDGGQRKPRAIEAAASPSRDVDKADNDPLTRELAKLGETDADNATRFVSRFGDRVKCTPGRGFLVYDGVRWNRDDLLHVKKLAEEVARRIKDETQYLAQDKERASRAQFSSTCLSVAGQQRMLDAARSHVIVHDREFDAPGMLLNVLNGTLDLKTGTLRPHDPLELLTKLAPVNYDPASKCPLFESFLHRAMEGDAELTNFLQKAMGLTLTADIGEQVFFFCYGDGDTGKSTLVNTFRDMLGDYGVHSATDTFLAKQFDNSHTTDLARLAGARMVTAIEADWNKPINEARIKSITGGEPITARFMRQDFFEFLPNFKLWFVANDLPHVRGTAGAFWRRVRIIPFDVTISEEEQDKDFVQKLRVEWPGILAWAVRGCLKWQAEGLQPPQSVGRGGSFDAQPEDSKCNALGQARNRRSTPINIKSVAPAWPRSATEGAGKIWGSATLAVKT